MPLIIKWKKISIIFDTIRNPVSDRGCLLRREENSTDVKIGEDTSYH